MPEILMAMIAGVVLGFFGSIPPTGPIALMIISRAFKGKNTFAVVTGVGGALAEIIYAGLAAAGVGLLVRQNEIAETAFMAVSTLVLVSLGVYFFISPLDEREIKKAGEEEAEGLADALGHLGKGFSVSIFNPTLILTWTVAVTFFFALFELDPGVWGLVAFALCVGLGKSSWAVFEVWLIDRYRERVSVGLLANIQRALSVGIILAGLVLGVRTLGWL
ncbi:MAG: LysE family translocator [Persicimonas sp.]